MYRVELNKDEWAMVDAGETLVCNINGKNTVLVIDSITIFSSKEYVNDITHGSVSLQNISEDDVKKYGVVVFELSEN